MCRHGAGSRVCRPAAGGFGAYLWNVARWGLAATISDIKLLERVGETFRAYHGRGIVEVRPGNDEGVGPVSN